MNLIKLFMDFINPFYIKPKNRINDIAYTGYIILTSAIFLGGLISIIIIVLKSLINKLDW